MQHTPKRATTGPARTGALALAMSAAAGVDALGACGGTTVETIQSRQRESSEVLPAWDSWKPDTGPAVFACSSTEGDDACTACVRASCCEALEACSDPTCRSAYRDFFACLTAPDGWNRSGFSSGVCLEQAGVANRGALELVRCALDRCAGGDACGAEPKTAFEPEATGADFSAAVFIESYCAGCHQPSYVSPSGNPVSILSKDPAWRAPFANADWLGALDTGRIEETGAETRCGVYPESLPGGCVDLVRPGFFTDAQKFPPSGQPPSAPSDAYGSGPVPAPPPVCTFSADGHSCPQPTPFERARMVSWIEAGFHR